MNKLIAGACAIAVVTLGCSDAASDDEAADLELLTIHVRLLICSIDKACELGIDWWRHDPRLSLGPARDARARPKLAARSACRAGLLVAPARGPTKRPTGRPRRAKVSTQRGMS